MNQRHVVVVGAGPAGASLSYLLARRGYVMVLPPLKGAVHDTLAVVLPGTATTLVGALGTVSAPMVTALARGHSLGV